MTTAVTMSAAELATALKSQALTAGFTLAGIAPAVTPPGFPRLQSWLAAGYHGTMQYLPRREAAYGHPEHVLVGVRSVLMVAANVRPEELAPLREPGVPQIAAYARAPRDYHAVLRKRLQPVADWLHAQRPGCRTRIVVDTAPLLERDFARLAGLGWFGKNTLLINKRAGSHLLLAGLLTDVELTPDAPHETAHCGTCTRCLEVCPTDAFPEAGVLDARRCISYLTIEHRGPIALEHREGIGEWLFGCDLCQTVCPWNTKAPATHDPAWEDDDDVLSTVTAAGWLVMSEDEFRQRCVGTPLERSGWTGIKRNAAIVLGNQRDLQNVPRLIQALADSDPTVRGAVAWALGRHAGDEPRAALQARLVMETDAGVCAEIKAALG